MRIHALLLLAGLGITIVSCKKNNDDVVTPGTEEPSAKDKLNDSVLLYARDIYLWYKNIPSGFDAHSFADPDALMEGIRPYSIETGFTNPVDKWSFAISKNEWDGISSGAGGDFGMGVFFLTNSDLRVSYTEKDSPAGKAGIKRGWRIKQINGSTGITPSNAEFIIDNVYYSNATSFVFTKPTGENVTLSLTAAGYQEHPVFLDSVYTVNGKKTGYLVFNSFLGDTSEIYSEFTRVFNKFTAQNVQDVILDLRYNGGGYVAVENRLANYLVPAAGNGGVMEVQQYNDKYSAFNETVKFSKKGSLELSRLFVIVSQNTASASELLINSLSPYMNVQLVGPSKTHGKPVGYFGIPVEDWYIFPVSFRTLNKNGEGNYFNGLSLQYQAMDGLDKDWGDTGENCLASILNFIASGFYARAELRTEQVQEGLSEPVQQGNTTLGTPLFKGTVATHGVERMN